MPVKRERLARCRREAGLTQEQLAERVGVDRVTIYRWEAGDVTPHPAQTRTLAAALDVTPAVLAELFDPGSSVESQSRETGSLACSLRRPATTDHAAVATLRHLVRGLDERYDRAPSISLLADAGQALGQIAFLARNGAAASIRRDLHGLDATAATLMGQLVWDASQRRDHQTARGYFQRARDAAREIGDPVAEGHALLRTSYVALYGERDPVDGLRLCQRTAAVAGGASHVLGGLADLHAAEAHAMLGDARQCEAALAAADTAFGRVSAGDPAAHLFSPDQHDRLAGSCYLALGEHRRAQRILDAAATAMTRPSKSRAIVLGNLALTHLRQSELDGAVVHLHDAIDVLEATRGGGGLNIVADAIRSLRCWRTEPAVHEVYDRVLTLMTAP